jgi:hypothetical protein
LNNPPGLSIRQTSQSGFIGDIHGDVLAPDNIEGLVGIWKIERIADLQNDTAGKVAVLGQDLSGLYQLWRQVDAVHSAAIPIREVACRSTHTAADIEDAAIPESA